MHEPEQVSLCRTPHSAKARSPRRRISAEYYWVGTASSCAGRKSHSPHTCFRSESNSDNSSVFVRSTDIHFIQIEFNPPSLCHECTNCRRGRPLIDCGASDKWSRDSTPASLFFVTFCKSELVIKHSLLSIGALTAGNPERSFPLRLLNGVTDQRLHEGTL